jgi:small subunit ribosomal protein S14
VAKTSQVHRDLKRERLIGKYQARRAELRKVLKDAAASLEDKRAALARLEKLPWNSCPARRNRRCVLTGRSRGYHRKFKMSRIMVRNLALQGRIPGVIKSSW